MPHIPYESGRKINDSYHLYLFKQKERFLYERGGLVKSRINTIVFKAPQAKKERPFAIDTRDKVRSTNKHQPHFDIHFTPYAPVQ